MLVILAIKCVASLALGQAIHMKGSQFQTPSARSDADHLLLHQATPDLRPHPGFLLSFSP